MFTISYRKLMSVLFTIRTVLGIGRRKSHHPVTVRSRQDRLTVLARTEDTLIGFEEAGSGITDGEFTVSLCELLSLGRSGCRLAFDCSGGQATASWQQQGQTVTRKLEVLPCPEFPGGNLVLHSNAPSFAKALKAASGLTDPESRRYSIGCLKLRSTDGQIAATDGQQAYVESGFNLPFGTHLVPAGALRHCDPLSTAVAVSVGLRDHWACFRIGTPQGRWTLDVKMLPEGRFPELDRCFPSADALASELSIAENDAWFLVKQLQRLSPDRHCQGPITLDLMSRPVVRVRLRVEEVQRLFPNDGSSIGSEAGYVVCEIPLGSSTVHGSPLCVSVDHLHLLNALNFGFRRFHFGTTGSPIFSRYGSRSYVCMAQSLERLIASVPERIEITQDSLTPFAIST